jgi:hypothetical protein
MKRLHLGLVILLPLPWFVQAAAPGYPVDPSVETVRSGGYWKTKRDRGHYRVIIVYRGFEQIQSHIRIEWVLDPTRGAGVEIARYEVLHESLLGSVDVESMQWDETGTVVVLAGPLQDGSQYRCRLFLGTDGSLNKGSGC